MLLTPGTRIGNYEVLSPLGAGGMGEVYRARDTRLERTVAIKALPPAFASDPERHARFEREAKLLASLSHPNIAAIYGLEEAGGSSYIVLEFVEGETLGARLSAGPLSPREALEFGCQMASAIEAAHERGIVHRDLKPGNVMITPARVVKVLDFGLAKGNAADSGLSPELTSSPTMALAATGQGVILGTASYMSPEQARGKAVDRRTDVWAFGCVLFECLTGRRCFPGETSSDVIARILEREPEWDALPAATPARLRELIRRCLTRNAEDRPRDIGDLRRELSGILLEMSSPSGLRSAAAEVPSLAVLYFENLATDQESEYFCAGITEDILTDLSKIRGLRVASRNAVARYRGQTIEPAKVGAELGVRTVLEGSVRRSGERVRITAQLINTADGFQLWAERYDRTLQDVFAVQEEIASAIAAALKVALSPGEAHNLVADRPADARAYDLYLKGRELYGRYQHESYLEARELFEKAIALEPDYALAYAGLADCCGQLLVSKYEGEKSQLTSQGLEAARRAIAINPKLPEAYKAEALVLRYTGDQAGAVAALQRALEVNPRFVPALINLAVDRVGRADLAAAERLLRRAIECEPQGAFQYAWLCWLLVLTGRTDALIPPAPLLREIEGNPFYAAAFAGMQVNLALVRGDFAGAQQAVRAGEASHMQPVNARALEIGIAGRAGRLDEVRRMLPEIERVDALLPGNAMLAAAAAIKVGRIDLAMDLITRQVGPELYNALVRLEVDLHPLLEREPLAPRRWDTVLVWPLEAPMIDAARFAVFREVHIQSGLPSASEISLR